MKRAEKELKNLFKSIDRAGNNNITKDELREAFEGAGLQLPKSKLNEFFANVDANNDGQISFAEWRLVLDPI